MKKEKYPVDPKNLFDYIDSNEADTIKFPNTHAQGDYVYSQREIISDGKIKKINAFTVMAARISDLSLRYLQKDFSREINYFNIREEVEQELEPFFNRYDLLRTENRPTSIVKEQTRIVNIKIEEEIQKHISRKLENRRVVKVDFTEFLDKLYQISPTSLFYKNKTPRFDRIIDMMEDIQKSAACEYHTKRVVIDDETKKPVIVDVVGKSIMVPSIEYELDESLGVTSIKELKENKKRDKSKYIKKIIFRFSPETFSMMVSPGREYTIAPIENRAGFNSIYGYRLDSLVRSIEKIQSYDNVNRYTLEKLNKLFGVNYTRFNDFKIRVLQPALKDVNKAKDIEVDFKTVKEGKRIGFIRFSIKRRKEIPEESTKSGEQLNLAYYIAVQHFYYSKYIENIRIDNFEEYYMLIREFIETTAKKSLSFGGPNTNDKSIREWEEEFIEAKEAWEKLQIVFAENEEWFKKHNTYPSFLKLTLVDADTNKVLEPIVGLLALENPIDSLKYYESENKDARK